MSVAALETNKWLDEQAAEASILGNKGRCDRIVFRLFDESVRGRGGGSELDEMPDMAGLSLLEDTVGQ